MEPLHTLVVSTTQQNRVIKSPERRMLQMYITLKELPSIIAGVTRVNRLSFALLDLGFCLSAACLLSSCDHGELLKCGEITFFLQLIISIIVLLGAVCGRAEHIFYYSQLFSYGGGGNGGQLLCIHATQSASSK